MDKINLQEVFRIAEQEVFQEGVTEAVKKVKHLLYKQSHLEKKIRIAESIIKKSNEKLIKVDGQLNAIKGGNMSLLGNINLKEDFSKEEAEHELSDS